MEVSADGLHWERKYRFVTPKTFQYPQLCEHQWVIWVSVTQGIEDPGGKERIMFGPFEQTLRNI